MKAEEQRQTVELQTAIALMKVVKRLQTRDGIPISEASALVTSVLPKCGKLIELWTAKRTKRPE
jgi:hypothetical protein